MAKRTGATVPGYIFPAVPETWSGEEKRFSGGLRQLFDQLFGRVREAAEGISEAGKELDSVKETIKGISEEIEGIGELSETVTGLSERVNGLGKDIEDIQKYIDEDLITDVLNAVYPVHVAVFGDQNAVNLVENFPGTWGASTSGGDFQVWIREA